jgi:hypothetical protein
VDGLVFFANLQTIQQGVNTVETAPQSRRAFVRKLAMLSLGAGLPALKPSLAWANAVAISAASQMMGLAAQFSAPGGGMSAMLRAELELQKFVIDRLAEIDTQLNQLRTDISLLPAKIREEARDQFKEELISVLIGQASLYANYLKQSTTYPETFSRPDIQSALAAMRFEVSKNRATLATTSYGPDMALIVPLAMALELACIYKTNGSKEHIAATLDGYQLWLDAMLSERKGSISDSIKTDIAKHDTIIDSLVPTRIGRMIDFTQFKISATQKAQSIVQPCVVTTGWKLSPTQLNPWKIPADMLRIFNHAVWSKMTIGTTDDPQLGVRMLTMKSDAELTVANHSASLMGYPAPLSECYISTVKGLIEPSKSPPRSRDEILRYVDDKLGTSQAESANINAGLSSANECRARIGYASLASQVAKNCVNLLRQQKQVNGLA